MNRTIELVLFAVAMLVAALATHVWLASRDEQHQLHSTMAAQQKVVTDAAARETTRDASLNAALSEIAKLKSAVQTPQQIVRELPAYLPLQQPIALGSESPSRTPRAENSEPSAQGHPPRKTAAGTSDHSDAEKGSDIGKGIEVPPEPNAIAKSESPLSPATALSTGSPLNAEMPAADLKPLYDYVQDCRAAQAQLTVAKQNASDDASRLAAVSRERDAAIAASRGGGFWRRLRHNAEWLAIGTAAGAVAASALHSSSH